jgi:hypothetical protein
MLNYLHIAMINKTLPQWAVVKEIIDTFHLHINQFLFGNKKRD